MLTLWNSASPFDRIFDDVLRNAFSGYYGTTREVAPTMEAHWTDQHLVMSLDVPGVKAEDLEVTTENGVVTIRGERKHGAAPDAHASERHARSTFKVSYQLPDTVEGDQLTAQLADGVLTVRVPRQPKAQPRRIPVEFASSNKQLGQ